MAGRAVLRVVRAMLALLVFSTVGLAAAPASGALPSVVADAGSMPQVLAAADYNGSTHAEVLRLYQAIFNRVPDLGGAKYWIDVNNQGYSVLEIAGFMSQSREWADNYNGTTNPQFVEKVYSNVLGRGYDQSGYDYWLNLVNSGKLSRPGMVFYVTANPEFTRKHPFAGTGKQITWSPSNLLGVPLGAAGQAESANDPVADSLVAADFRNTDFIHDFGCVQEFFTHRDSRSSWDVDYYYDNNDRFAGFTVSGSSLPSYSGFRVGIDNLERLRQDIPELPATWDKYGFVAASINRNGLLMKVSARLANRGPAVSSVSVGWLDAAECGYPEGGVDGDN